MNATLEVAHGWLAGIRRVPPDAGIALSALFLLAGCSTYRRGEVCARDGDTLVLRGGHPVEVDVEAGCVRVGAEPVRLDLDVTFWCEWTNDWDEDEARHNGCTSSGGTYVRFGGSTCARVSAWCTDYPPLVDDDPVHNAGAASVRFCDEAEDLPLCED